MGGSSGGSCEVSPIIYWVKDDQQVIWYITIFNAKMAMKKKRGLK
jgi:hypothetical protein